MDDFQEKLNLCQKVKNSIKTIKGIKEDDKLDILELLGQFEGELQARDIALAAYKSEYLKSLVYCVDSGKKALDDPNLAFRRDGEFAHSSKDPPPSNEAVLANEYAHFMPLIEAQKSNLKKLMKLLRDSEKQRTNLLKELEEEQMKHEDDTAQGDDITYGLEKERIRLRQELEKAVADKKQMEADLDAAKSSLQTEKAQKKQIVLLLLSDRKKLLKLYLEEKKRSEDLAHILSEEKEKINSMAIGLEEESKRSLEMEAELERHLARFSAEREQSRMQRAMDEKRAKDLEDALKKARSDAEHFRKQLAEAHRVAMSQASATMNYSMVPPTSGNEINHGSYGYIMTSAGSMQPDHDHSSKTKTLEYNVNSEDKPRHGLPTSHVNTYASRGMSTVKKTPPIPSVIAKKYPPPSKLIPPPVPPNKPTAVQLKKVEGHGMEVERKVVDK